MDERIRLSMLGTPWFQIAMLACSACCCRIGDAETLVTPASAESRYASGAVSQGPSGDRAVRCSFSGTKKNAMKRASGDQAGNPSFAAASTCTSSSI
jgi:hypothetical protein